MSVPISKAPSASATGLLHSTFVHLAGIGARTERRLWQAGIDTWEALRGTPWADRPEILGRLDASDHAHARQDLNYFHEWLPSSERWRTFADFSDRFVSVDIETTGMSPVYDHVTVIGIEHHGRYETFVRGANLDDARELLADAGGLVTFNGARFDLPFLHRTFPELRLPAAHLDLRFLARRVGLAGPLKTVERLAELRRAESLEDLSGYAATVLWADYEHDDDLEALAQLVLYNAADTLVLRPLAQLVCDQLRHELVAYPEPDDTDQLALELLHQTWVPWRYEPPVRDLEPLPAVRRRGRQLHVGRGRVKLPARQLVTAAFTLGALHARMRDPLARVVGIDLTGSQTKPSGWALLEGDQVITGLVGSDAELLARTLACRPRLVSIDSPLSLPSGRHCASDDCPCRAVGGIMRESERELKRRGVNVYPCLIQSMQALTVRGMRLAGALRAEGVEVIESYPGAAQDVMRIPRKRASQRHLRAGLVRFGVRGLRPRLASRTTSSTRRPARRSGRSTSPTTTSRLDLRRRT